MLGPNKIDVLVQGYAGLDYNVQASLLHDHMSLPGQAYEFICDNLSIEFISIWDKI